MNFNSFCRVRILNFIHDTLIDSGPYDVITNNKSGGTETSIHLSFLSLKHHCEICHSSTLVNVSQTFVAHLFPVVCSTCRNYIPCWIHFDWIENAEAEGCRECWEFVLHLFDCTVVSGF